MKKVLRITAKPAAGFRRCGTHHPATAVDHPAGTFTDAQIAVLKADKNLTVVDVEIPDAPTPDEGEGVNTGPQAVGADPGAPGAGGPAPEPAPEPASQAAASAAAGGKPDEKPAKPAKKNKANA